MKIILLSGTPNSGKTTTLNLLYDRLIKDGTENVLQEQLGANPKDFKCVVSYKGKTVAIYTMGDYKTVFEDAIIEFADCDVLIFAYNDNFAKRLLDKFTGKFQHYRIIQKTDSNKNDQDAILSEI
jgi:hypothetical protein